MKTKNIHVQNKGKQRKQIKKQQQQRDFKSMRIKASKTAMTSIFPMPQQTSKIILYFLLG